MSKEGEARPVSQVSKITVPDYIPESTGIQGFAFSRKFISAKDFSKLTLQKSLADQQILRDVAEKARRASRESDG